MSNPTPIPPEPKFPELPPLQDPQTCPLITIRNFNNTEDLLRIQYYHALPNPESLFRQELHFHKTLSTASRIPYITVSYRRILNPDYPHRFTLETSTPRVQRNPDNTPTINPETNTYLLEGGVEHGEYLYSARNETIVISGLSNETFFIKVLLWINRILGEYKPGAMWFDGVTQFEMNMFQRRVMEEAKYAISRNSWLNGCGVNFSQGMKLANLITNIGWIHVEKLEAAKRSEAKGVKHSYEYSSMLVLLNDTIRRINDCVTFRAE